MQILLVDDSDSDAYLVEGLLARHLRTPYELERCCDAGEALARLTRHDVDVCLLDQDLGEVDGLAMLAELKHRDVRVPVIMLTGAQDPAVDDAAHALGAADFLPKAELTGSLLARSIRYAQRTAQLMQQLRAQNQELRRAARAKDEFIAMVSHELRTPLTAIHAATRLIAHREDVFEPGQRDTCLDIILRNAHRLNRIVDDILDLAKLDAQRIHYDMQQLTLNDALMHAHAEFQPIFGEQEVTLVPPKCDVELRAEVDAGRLQQVLGNLLSNALKFSPPRSEVHLELRRHDRDSEIVVRDQGPGIPGEALAQVFEPFFQVDSGESRAVNGTGLGLALCRRIIEEGFSGQIWAESPCGQGASLHIRLPPPTSITSHG